MDKFKKYTHNKCILWTKQHTGRWAYSDEQTRQDSYSHSESTERWDISNKRICDSNRCYKEIKIRFWGSDGVGVATLNWRVIKDFWGKWHLIYDLDDKKGASHGWIWGQRVPDRRKWISELDLTELVDWLDVGVKNRLRMIHRI